MILTGFTDEAGQPLATVFHAKEGEAADEQACYDSYVNYGKSFKQTLRSTQGLS